jgi:hypothetical protein
MAAAAPGTLESRRAGRLPVGRALLLGGLTAGVLDLLDALVFFGLRGAAPSRILQSIAAGVLGRASYQGGTGSAALGLVLHFVIALLIVATYFGVVRALPILNRRPFLAGPLFGLAAYFVMNYIVVPMSAIGSGPHPGGAVLVNGLLIHAFGVGLPAALFAKAAFTGR